MDVLYIGSKYDIGNIGYKDKSELDKPYVVLYSPSSKKTYEAVVEDNGDNTYHAYISQEVSKTIMPGVYALEVYSDNTMAEMLLHDADYVKAIRVAASEISETQNP
jgi:hypothetical protein